MKLYKLAPAIALAMATTLFSLPGRTSTAGTTNDSTAGALAKPGPQEAALAKFSRAGNSAMQDVRDARFALFDGSPKTAISEMEAAKKFLGQAEKEAPEFDTTSKILVDGKVVQTTSEKDPAMSVPFDGQLSLVDDYLMTPEKKVHIDKANEHFKKGEREQGLKELRLGEIDVDYTRSLMPLIRSEKHLAQAIQLANNGKYYEANLALKAIEDGVTYDSVDLRGIPQGVKK